MISGISIKSVLAACGLILGVAAGATAVDFEPSPIDLDQQRLKYGTTAAAVAGAFGHTASAIGQDEKPAFGQENEKKKSPFKAFLLSAAVPGLGQWYYGSRIKPFLFAGVEVAAWGLHIKYHSEGEDATDVYEAFNRAHWSEDDYTRYLMDVYGVSDDELANATEVSHHLPDTQTQQFFEMTGKYNQFAWGWDDATLRDSTLDLRLSTGTLTAVTAANTPTSARRTHYEGLRHDANNKFDKATNMIMVSIVNRIVSAMEAYLVTNMHNNRRSDDNGFMSRTDIKASMKSVSTTADTPFLTFSYKF